MDIGFIAAGVDVLFSNELDSDAAATYAANIDSSTMHVGDIADQMEVLSAYRGADIVFGGPPCQGFSVAGKMNPDDERSRLVDTFLDVVELIQPKLFVMENVKALGTLPKWAGVRERLFLRARHLGYGIAGVVLQAANYGVPQNRERFFFVGIKGITDDVLFNTLSNKLVKLESAHRTVRDALGELDDSHLETEDDRSVASLRLAKHPILRRSAYNGSLLFNGRGRPLELDSIAKTLPAQMGGNHTPIVDQALLDDPDGFDWIADYHQKLLDGAITPEAAEGHVPKSLRRITVREAAALQTFPKDYVFCGKRNKKYRQIGNAVPCKLAYAVASASIEVLSEAVAQSA